MKTPDECFSILDAELSKAVERGIKPIDKSYCHDDIAHCCAVTAFKSETPDCFWSKLALIDEAMTRLGVANKRDESLFWEIVYGFDQADPSCKPRKAYYEVGQKLRAKYLKQ